MSVFLGPGAAFMLLLVFFVYVLWRTLRPQVEVYMGLVPRKGGGPQEYEEFWETAYTVEQLSVLYGEAKKQDPVVRIRIPSIGSSRLLNYDEAVALLDRRAPRL